jgi:Ca-activated chloride channel homolog
MKTWGMLFVGLAILGALISVGVAGGSAYREMEQGSDAYKNGQYPDSMDHFLKAQVESPDDLKVRFNLASAQYKTGRYDEAAEGFKAVVMQSHDPKLKQKAIYNLGNTSFRQGNLPAAINFYRRAIVLDPSDLEARQNLEFVLMEREKNREEKGQDVSMKEERQKGQKDLAPQSQNGGAQNNDPEVAQTGGQPIKQGALSPDEAERLLNSLSDDQRPFLKEQAKRSAPPVGVRTKDW